MLCCSVLCIIIGLGALVVFVIAFSLPYWFLEDTGFVNIYHGLWQSRICMDGEEECDSSGIDFGVSAAFEAARVFGCATILAGLVAFIFTVILIQHPSRAWAIRSGVVWWCTVAFNLLVCGLFGGAERRTLEELQLGEMDPEVNIVTRLYWAYWLTVCSLVLFTLVALSCCILSCTRYLPHHHSSSNTSTNRKKKTIQKHMLFPGETLFRKTPMPEKFAYPENGFHTFPAPVNTHRIANDVPKPAAYMDGGQISNSVYSVTETPSGYTIFPNRAAANIDNTGRSGVGILNVPNYIGNRPTLYSTGGEQEKTILNKPRLSPAVVTVPRNNNHYEGGMYRMSIDTSGNVTRESGDSFLTAGAVTSASSVGDFTFTRSNLGPPDYSTYPRTETLIGGNSNVSTFDTGIYPRI